MLQYLQQLLCLFIFINGEDKNEKIALLAMVAMLAVNAYAVEIGIGGKLGAGIAMNTANSTNDGDNVSSARELALPMGGELFVNLGFSELIALQLGVALSYSIGIGDIWTRTPDGDGWSDWNDAEERGDLSTGVFTVGLDILARINLPIAFPLYVAIGPNVSYARASSSDDGDSQGGVHFVDIAGVLEVGTELAVGPGNLLIGLRSRIGGSFALSTFDADGNTLDDIGGSRLLLEFAALRVGYSINLG
ncbi:MAG: porin family protein [Spirochaetaceae bacterium]|nr:porin family protein [Spirochaetaceae bacterium]